MADPYAPVAAGIIPPNPNQGLTTLSNLLGLQQQKQALQTGQYTQASAQAEAQGAQQTMQERQLLQRTLKTGIRPDTGTSLYNANNELDSNELMDFANKNLALTGQSVVQNILKTKQDKTALSSAVADLGDKYNNDISGRIRSFVNHPEATSAVVNDSLAGYAKQNPEAAAAVLAAQNLVKHLDNADGMKAKNDQLIHLSQMFQPASTTAAQQQPSAATYQGAKGVQPFQTNPLAAGGVQNIGKPLGPQGVAPTMTTPPGGIPTPYVPGGSVASPGKGPNASGPMPTDQDLARQNDYETKLNNRVQIGTDAQSVIRETEQAVNSIRSGAGASTRASIAKTLQALGAPQGLVDSVSGGDLGATQEAEKMLFQQTLMGLRQSMQGDAAHVSEFNEANAVFPNIDTDPRAKQKIMNFISNKADRDYAEQQSLSTSKKNGTFNPATWQADYQQQLRAGKVPGTPASQIPSGVKTIVRTGTFNGKKVAEYSDGTHAYVQ